MIFSNFIPGALSANTSRFMMTTSSQSSTSDLSDAEDTPTSNASATVCRLRRLMRASTGRSVGRPTGSRWAARAAAAASVPLASEPASAPSPAAVEEVPAPGARQWQLERKYTMSEVQQHCSLDDCWMVIFDKVYDISEFVNEHPGGDFILLEYAGRDATHPFLSSRHGSSAYKMLDKYWIGILVDEELYYSNNSSYCSVYSNLSWRSTPTMKDASSEPDSAEPQQPDTPTKTRTSTISKESEGDQSGSSRLTDEKHDGQQTKTSTTLTSTAGGDTTSCRNPQQLQHECNTCNTSSGQQSSAR